MYCWTLSKPLSDNTFAVEEKARAKGIQRAAMRDVRFADYERQIHAPQEHRIVNRRIGSHLHHIYTYEYGKKGLCAFDDKRYILEDGISTLAYGHFRVELNDDRRQRAHTANDTERVQTFAETTRQSGLRNLTLEDDDDEVFHGEETIGTMNWRREIAVRPGLDPDQHTWKARLLQLDQAFAEEDPLDMLDLLTFVA
jgi:hypothetical protein